MEERRAPLNRVLWSRLIAKFARIRDFPVYVCETAMQDQPSEVHEQEIGHRVLWRAPDYDTSQDNIVRVIAPRRIVPQASAIFF